MIAEKHWVKRDFRIARIDKTGFSINPAVSLASTCESQFPEQVYGSGVVQGYTTARKDVSAPSAVVHVGS